VSSTGRGAIRRHNQTITRRTRPPTLKFWRYGRPPGPSELSFVNTTLYVTNEPCIMCMGAIVHARWRPGLRRRRPQMGRRRSLYDLAADSRLNHRLTVTSGVCETACRKLLQDSFGQTGWSLKLFLKQRSVRA
jgi:tRNA(Arg) A34 adenosine deaminase TadA